MRALVDRQTAKHKLLKFASKLKTARSAIAQYDAGHRLAKFVSVPAEDDRHFLHRRMLRQYALNFDGAHPRTADFQHLVGSSRIPEIPLLILMILVTGAEPCDPSATRLMAGRL